MAEHTIKLKKDVGGSGVTAPDGTVYEWPKDDSVVEVPYAFGEELLAIKGAGFSVADEKAAEKTKAKVDEERASQAPDEPPRDKPVDVPGLEARAPGGLDLPEAQEQLPARPIAKRSPGRPRGSRSAAKKD